MNRIREIRMQKGLTQDHMARVVGRSRPSYTRWENGDNEPDFESLQRIANYFDCSIDYLLGRSDDLSRQNKESAIPGEGQPINELAIALAKRIMDLPSKDQERALDYVELLESQDKP